MDRSSPGIDDAALVDVLETELIDLGDVRIDELRMKLVGPLEPYVNRVMSSIERPRANLGGTGPPGRDD